MVTALMGPVVVEMAHIGTEDLLGVTAIKEQDAAYRSYYEAQYGRRT